MADISAFPTITNVLWAGDNIITLKAGGTIKAGQVVAIDATGVSMTVRAGIAEAGERPVGVALHDASSGDYIAVATVGCVCYVANADDTTGIDAGDPLTTNDNSVGGTVSAGTVGTNPIVGFALDDIAGGGTGRMIISLC